MYSHHYAEQGMADVIGAALLLSALALAPFIGGGFGELTGGVLQILVIGGIGLRLAATPPVPPLAKGGRCVLPLADRGEDAPPLTKGGTGGVPGCKDSAEWVRVPGLWFLAAFAILMVASTFTSHCLYFSLNGLLFAFACLGAYVLSATVCRDKRIAAAAVWVLLVSAMLAAVLGIHEYAMSAGGGPNFWKAILKPGEHARLFGRFVNPSFFAGFLVIALPVTLAAYLVTRKTILSVFAGLGFVTNVLALMLTGAKWGIAAAVASLGIFFLLAIFTRSLRRSKFLRLLVICAVVIPVMLVFSPVVTSRIHAAEAGGSQVHSTEFRIRTWYATADMIDDRPWLGFGPGTYAITYPRYTVAGPTRLAHSSYLQTAAECGLPALAALLLLLGAVAHRSLMGITSGAVRPADHPREDEPASESITWADMVPFSGWRLVNCALFAALFGSAIRSLVDSDWYVLGVALPFWITAGVLVAQSGAAERESRYLSPISRWVSAGVCLAAILLSASFALGDYWAARARAAAEANSAQEAVSLFRRATAVSPLDPEYHRMLGVWAALGTGDFEYGLREINTAIRLAPNTSEGGWYARALLEGHRRNWRAAISDLKTALKFSPNSTQTLLRLAQAYRAIGDKRGCEAAFKRLIDIETSPYEEIKGTPEIVDTTYAVARAYFGAKAVQQKKYSSAVAHYQTAIGRLERWRESGDMRKVQKMMGMMTDQDEQANIELLRDCYYGLAAAYEGLGDRRHAADALAMAETLE